MTLSTAAQVKASRAKRRIVHAPARKSLAKHEGDPEKWLLYYLPRSYPLAFGQVHRDIIAETVYAIEHGGKTAHAAPRGTGKSTLINGLTLWALLTKRSLFPVVLPWADKARKQAIRFWVNELCFNSRLHRDYPDATLPFKQCGGISNKLATLTDPATGETTGAALQVTDGMIVLPKDLGAIGSATINGNPRGLNYKTRAGDVMRPTLCVIDDPQDRKTAKSPARVRDTIEKINGDVAGMAGPDSAMPILMPCTVINKGDVADNFLNDPDWRAIRVPQIVTWPKGWTDKGSITRALWEAWNEERTSGGSEKDGGARSKKFYAEHFAAMTEGMTVSWAERYDKKRGQPDALYAAMWDFYSMGEAAFMAERQNAPLESITSQYELTTALILSHAIAMPRLHLPDAARTFVGFIDINRIGLHYVVAGFDQSMTGHCPAWGRWPAHGELWAKNAPELERKQAIFRGLKEVCGALAATTFARSGARVNPSLVLIDRGYEPDVVHKFSVAAAYPFRCMPSRGYAAQKYWPKKSMLVGKAMEGCHYTQGEAGQYLAFNADMWRETMQRAFLADVGAPGGFTMHAAPTDRFHQMFAEHVCAEKLDNKYETDGGLRWEWRHKPGALWDLGDCVTGCWVAAASLGLSPSGQPTIPKKSSTRARVRGVSIISM